MALGVGSHEILLGSHRIPTIVIRIHRRHGAHGTETNPGSYWALPGTHGGGFGVREHDSMSVRLLGQLGRSRRRIPGGGEGLSRSVGLSVDNLTEPDC